MTNIATLANNITSSVRSLATTLGLMPAQPAFPESPELGITSQFQKEHWYKQPSQGLYAFSVEEAGSGTVSEFPEFIANIQSLFKSGQNSGKWGEFKLPITPQDIQQTEDFAVSIKPTQGGTVVNHSGNKYKTLSISGNTGVQPFKSTAGADRATGNAFGFPDELAYRSGYEVFLHFRNWIKSYHQEKSKSGTENLRMMFRNYKDWEFLYVEPIKFTMRRNAAKPLLYEYQIQFKVLGVHTLDKPLYELAISKISEIVGKTTVAVRSMKAKNNVLAPLVGDIDGVMEGFRTLNSALNAATFTKPSIADLDRKIIGSLTTNQKKQVSKEISVKLSSLHSNPKSAEDASIDESEMPADPQAEAERMAKEADDPSNTDAQKVGLGLTANIENAPGAASQVSSSILPPEIQALIAREQEKAAGISRVEVRNIQTKAQAMYDKLADSLGMVDALYNQIYGLTSTGSLITGEITDAQFEAMYNMSTLINSVDGVLASDEMFDTNAAIYNRRGSTNGADTVGVGIFSTVKANSGVREGKLPEGMTLEAIALQELGDSSRWTEIADLNGLKAPYILPYSDTLSASYVVQSLSFKDPGAIANLNYDDIYVVTSTPTPVGAWAGKGNYLAKFNNGTGTSTGDWLFIFPEEGLTVQHALTEEYHRFTNGVWELVDESLFSTDGVLRPGDTIKIPSDSSPPIQTILPGPRDNIYTSKISNAEKSLAIDLKLNETMDLDLLPSGDLNASIGVDNGAQAIILKLLYEKGDLKKFPSIGTNLTSGKKNPDLAALRTDVLTTLLQDNRIQDVKKINITQNSSKTFVNFEVIFKDIQQPIPVTIPV